MIVELKAFCVLVLLVPREAALTSVNEIVPECTIIIIVIVSIKEQMVFRVFVDASPLVFSFRGSIKSVKSGAIACMVRTKYKIQAMQ